MSDSVTAWHEYHEQRATGGGGLVCDAPPAPAGERTVEVRRMYQFAAGQHHFYGPAAELDHDGPGASLVTQDGAKIYPMGYFRAFAEGRVHELPPVDVLRVIIYEWLRGGGA